MRKYICLPVCLVCGAHVSVTKEHNTRRHYETKHQDEYKDLDVTQRSQRVGDEKKFGFTAE